MHPRILALVVTAALAGGCGTGAKLGATTSGSTTVVTTETEVETDTIPIPPPAPPPTTTTPASNCPTAAHVLDGVYHPNRLQVIDPCYTLQVTVKGYRHETDGDIHIYTTTTDPSFKYKPGAGGYFIVEFTARDAGHFAVPVVGQTITVTGSLNLDTDHGWNELHPVFQVVLPSGQVEVSGPQFGGSPAGDSATQAAADCRDKNGKPCVGYPNVSGIAGATNHGVQPRGDSRD